MWRVTVLKTFEVEAMNKEEARERVIYRNPYLRTEDLAIHVEPTEEEFG